MILKKKFKKLKSQQLKNGTFKSITQKSSKEAQDICRAFLCDIWAEDIVRKGTFPKDLKNADVTLVFKKTTLFKLETADLEAFGQQYLKYLKE